MEFLTNTKFPFLKYRKLLMILSVVAIVLSFALFFTKELNFGIDFKGGTQLVAKLRNDATTDDVRNALAAGGLPDAQIQQYGKPEDQEFLIRAPLVERVRDENTPAGTSAEEGRSREIIQALDTAFNTERVKVDLNQRGASQLSEMLIQANPDARTGSIDEMHKHYDAVADAIIAQRRAVGIFSDWSQVGAAAGVSPAVTSYLQGTGVLGNVQITSNESVGAAIGQELRTKGVWAVLFSLLAMLIYIWARFELRFGIGAMMASLHDVVVTLGLFCLFDYEFGLTTIAAFLTLVGFSINDTVVIFDRVRENMRRHRRMNLEQIMDLSINETLPRTMMTSGTMLLSCAALFFFGGEVLRGFSFVMLVGVIIGTYSSIFIASPFALWWDEMANKRSASELTKSAQV